jgi:hypothetical protein
MPTAGGRVRRTAERFARDAPARCGDGRSPATARPTDAMNGSIVPGGMRANMSCQWCEGSASARADDHGSANAAPDRLGKSRRHVLRHRMRRARRQTVAVVEPTLLGCVSLHRKSG